MKIDVEAATDEEIVQIEPREELLIRREPGKFFFTRNRHAIWRLVVIATLTAGLGALLLPIVACM